MQAFVSKSLNWRNQIKLYGNQNQSRNRLLYDCRIQLKTNRMIGLLLNLI